MAKISKRELDSYEEARKQREGTAGWVQCDGCPDVSLRPANRPGHLSDCRECYAHCCCPRPSAADAEYDGQSW